MALALVLIDKLSLAAEKHLYNSLKRAKAYP
jgi:hypothetical protein